MRKNIFTIAIIAIIFVLSSCEKDEVKNDFMLENVLFEQNDYNNELSEFTNSVRNALKSNEDFRCLIKSEAIRQFDGDYDVLVSRIIDKKLSSIESVNGINKVVSNYTVKNLLEDSYFRNNGSKLKVKSDYSPFEELLKMYPLLQISIPENAEKWNSATEIPIITFIPKEYEDGVTKFVTGYTNDGKIIRIDAVNPPDYPVIVIGQNERIEENGEVIQFANSEFNIENPTSLNAVATSTGVMLNWLISANANTNNITGYNIYRKSPSDNDFVLLSTCNGVYNQSYFDNTTTTGLTYLYYIRSYYDTEVSTPSNTVSVIASNRPASVLSFSAEQNNASEIKLKWSTDNSQYIEKVLIYKQVIGNTNNLYKEFQSNIYECFDNNLEQGKKVEYSIQIKTPTGISNPKYDFINIPYRDPSTPSPVIIRRLSYTDSSLENWLRGRPEFHIKVLNVGTDKKTPYEVQDEIRCNYSLFGDRYSQSFSSTVLNWKPGFWFDMLTFYVIESDSSDDWEFTFAANLNYKDTINKKLGVTSSIGVKYNFSKSGQKIGYQYLDYYQDKNITLNFPNYGFKMTLSDNTSGRR